MNIIRKRLLQQKKAKQTNNIDLEDIKNFYNLLGHKQETEIRAIELSKDFKKSWVKGHFFVNSEEDFLEKVKNLNGKYNIYAGLNERISQGTEAKDVILVKRIFLDIDCKIKPSNEEDISEARRVTDQIIKDLEEQFNTRPYKIFSGNGFQLIYSIPEIEIKEDNREEINSKVQGFTRELIKKYSNDKVQLDNVGDLPRIIRITGTKNIKGGNVSGFEELGSGEESQELRDYILSLEPEVTSKTVKEIKVKVGELETSLKEALDKDERVKRLFEGNTTGFNSRSEAEQSLIFHLIGLGLDREQIFKIMASCKIGKWQEANLSYRDLTYSKALEKVTKEKRNNQFNKELSEAPEEIKQVLLNENLFNEITVKEFDKKIVGEVETRKVIFLCGAGGRLIENCQVASYNLLVNDDAGAGKDYVTGKVLEMLPKEFYIHKTRISPTVFTYWHNSEFEPEWTWDGKVFYPEDISETVLNSDVFKVMCSGGSSATITIRQRAVDIEIIGKPVMITTTATATPNPELTRRFVILNLDSSEEQTKQIMKRHSEFKKRGIVPEYQTKYTEALRYLKRVKVKIPFANLIDKHFPTKNIVMRTNYPRFLDFISASAGLHQYQRERDEEGFILANGQDYDIARECFLKLCSNKYMISLTINQRKILEVFEKEPFLKGSMTQLHPLMNFISERSLLTNLQILTKFGILQTEVSKDSWNRDIEVYGIAKSFSPNERLFIPSFEEICRITSEASEPSIPSIPSIPSEPLNNSYKNRVGAEDAEGSEAGNDIAQLIKRAKKDDSELNISYGKV